MIDRVAAQLGRRLVEVPVGFKYFVTGCSTARWASAARRAPAPPSCAATARRGCTDKDGLLLGLLAAEMTARDGPRPGRAVPGPHARAGRPGLRAHRRRRRRRSRKAALARLTPEQSRPDGAGRRADRPPSSPPRPATVSRIGGIKVVTEHGWFAARPSGTEDVYKLYAESFRGPEHLRRIQEEAQAIIQRAFAAR